MKTTIPKDPGERVARTIDRDSSASSTGISECPSPGDLSSSSQIPWALAGAGADPAVDQDPKVAAATIERHRLIALFEQRQEAEVIVLDLEGDAR